MQAKIYGFDKCFLSHRKVNNSARRIIGRCLRYQNAQMLLWMLLRSETVARNVAWQIELHKQMRRHNQPTVSSYSCTPTHTACFWRMRLTATWYPNSVSKKKTKRRRRSEENTNRPKHVSSQRNFFSVIFLVETISGTAANIVCVRTKSK